MDALEAQLRRSAQRAGQQLLGRLALGGLEQCLRLGGLEAELQQAVAGEVARIVAARDGDRRPEVVRHADLLAQLDHDPLRRALADAGHRLQAGDVAGHQRAHQLARGSAAEHRERHLRPHRLHADESQEEVALLLGGEAVEGQRVVAHDQMGVQRHRAAHAGHLAQRLGRHGQAIADPAGGLDHDVVGTADRHLPGDERDHPATAAAAANGA